jgi:uncharacterized protein (DUF305 family)
MNISHSLRVTGTILAALTIQGCGGSPAPQPTATPQPNAAAQPDTASKAHLEALYDARTDSARQRFTEADVRFMTGMIGHHGQALVMAAFAPTHGASPSVQRLCSRILNAQRDEIKTMQTWLRDRGQPVPEVHVEGATMMVHGPEYTMHMPGMLTQEQLNELDAARGPDFDRLFLTDMIQHHQGAVDMVHDLFATDGAGQDQLAFKIASDIQVDQTTEIARMKQMLAALPSSGNP